MHYIFLLLAFILTTTQAFARPLTASEHTALSAVVEDYIADMEQKQFAGVMKIVPDRIVNHYSGIVEMSPEQFREMMATQTNETMRDVIIQSFKVNLSDLDVTEATNMDGTAAIYAVLPYTMLMNLNAKPYNETSILLALYETERWWLVRFDPAQTEMLIVIYPFLKDVDF